ncbi:MAG: hypothetical protein JWP25_9007 [Bradyrhizobium sp.]|nr:hypothetical protein [Bradyrhizobium sp.]
MSEFPALTATLRELAAMYWREGDHIQASALHMRAVLLEAGWATDARPTNETRTAGRKV